MSIGRNTIRNTVMWILGMIICPLGVALSANAGFGVSMIEAPVFVTFNKVNQYFPRITFGACEYMMQALVLIILCISIGRFKWRYLLSFGTAVLFGFILDGWRLILGEEVAENIGMRIFLCLAGIIITSFAVACFFRTKLPQEVWELFVKEFSERYGYSLSKVKWIYDLSSLALGVVLMLIFFKGFRFEYIGAGTIITTLVNAPLITLMGKIIDKIYKE